MLLMKVSVLSLEDKNKKRQSSYFQITRKY